jgi:hypothetical protein
MVIRWISEVSSEIVKIFASRCHRSTGNSCVYPLPPGIWIACSVTPVGATAAHRPMVTYPDTCRDREESTRRAAFPQHASRSAGGGRSRVRTWVGLADGSTDLSFQCCQMVLTCINDPLWHPLRRGCPLYVRERGASSRRVAWTATDTVRGNAVTYRHCRHATPSTRRSQACQRAGEPPKCNCTTSAR